MKAASASTPATVSQSATRHPPSGPRARDSAAATSGSDDDPAGVLRRRRQPEPEAGDRVVAPAAVAEDAHRAPQRQAHRRERRGIVERELAVGHRQERDRHHGGGEQARAAVEQPRAGEVEQPHGERAEDRRGEPGEHPDLGGVGRVVQVIDGIASAEPQLQQPGEHVGEGRRVAEVLRVQVAAEHRDRVGHEMLGLVDVVDPRQAAAQSPHAQRERDPQDRGDGGAVAEIPAAQDPAQQRA